MKQTKRSAARLRLLACAAFGAIAAAAVPGAAHAQAADAALTAQHDFNLPAQPLSRSITQVASISGLQVLYSDDMANDAQAPAIKGRMSAQEALSRLLAGSGFALRYTSDKVVTLVKVPVGNGADGEVVTGVVSVEGTQGSPYFGGAGQAAGVNGVNGSRDITATEGTGSFTSGALTIGSKVPQALKDVPQSISVLTNERLEQQNVTDFTTALQQLPGVTLVQGGTNLDNTFYSRGFAITNIQVDGGAPMSSVVLPLAGSIFYPQLDMSEYDHVELLRGAAGTFNGYGDPGGTVNLVRKKPLDHGQFMLDEQAGSWANYRVSADASSPLAFDGKLRGRVVLTYQDNHQFYDVAKDNKTLVYGIVEADLTPTTLLTAGLSYTRQHSVPFSSGLPRYQNGDDLNLPRSTSLAFPWNRWDFSTREIFSSIEQKIGKDWVFKINYTNTRQATDYKYGYSTGAVNPLTDHGPTMSAFMGQSAYRQYSAEATMTGAFSVFGQRQEIAVGINRSSSDGAPHYDYGSLIAGTAAAPYQPYPGGPTYYSGSPNGSRPPIDVFDFDPTAMIYNEPANARRYDHYDILRQVVTVGYANVRLTAFDRLHLTTGLRWSRYDYHNQYYRYCQSIPASGDPSDLSCVGRTLGDIYWHIDRKYRDNTISWPPTVSLSFDISRNLDAYVTYADIYQSQGDVLDADLNPIAPITGSNIEAGFKWESSDHRLNISLSGYRIRKRGFPILDGTYDYNVSADDIAQGIDYYFVSSTGNRVPNGHTDIDHSCCFKADPNQVQMSEGIDAEIVGELRKGWQISASYTFNRNRQTGSSYTINEGLPFVSIQPEHLYKIWTTYDFGVEGNTGWLSGLALSLGVNGQSSGYQSGTACVNLNPPNALGISTCKSFDEPDTVPYQFTVPAYAVVSGRIDYRLSPQWSLTVNLDNILDKTYYKTTGSVTGGNWYGEPRSVTIALHAKW